VSAQSSLANNPILRSLSNKLEDDNEPDDTRTHRSVGVDPKFYDMVDDNIISILLDACKPLFALVARSNNDPDSGGDSNNSSTSMKHADLVMNTANLIISAGFKMKEQARQEMEEEDLGGGMFDQDVKGMRLAASKCNEPQVYDAEEQETLDAEFELHEATTKSLKKISTRTKLYSLDIADTGSGVEARVMTEVRTPAEQVSLQTANVTKDTHLTHFDLQVIAYLMGHKPEYEKYRTGENKHPSEMGERRSDHSVVSRTTLPMPNPFNDREIVIKSMWKKLDERTYFFSQTTCQQCEFPERPGIVRVIFRRSVMVTKISAKVSRVEMNGSANLGGQIPRRINDTVTVPFVAKSVDNLIR
jgi:hypothetical protein